MVTEKNSVEKSSINLPLFAKTCFAFLISLVLFLFFYLDLTEFLRSYIAQALFLPFIFVFLILLFVSFYVFITNIKSPSFRTSFPLLINIITILIVFFLPLRDSRINLEFKINEDNYKQVVQWIENNVDDGKMNPDNFLYEREIMLPEEYQNVTFDGTIYIIMKRDTLFVFFPMAGKMHHYSRPGFLYNSTKTAHTGILFSYVGGCQSLDDYWKYCE